MELTTDTGNYTTRITTLEWLDDNRTLPQLTDSLSYNDTYDYDKQPLWNDSLSYNDTYDYEKGNETAGNAYDEYDIFKDMPDLLRSYEEFHYSIHGYLTLAIIFFGTIGNIISMVVLTRKNMITSINIILTALAVADMGVLLTYLVKIKFHTNLKFLSYTEITYTFAMFNLYVKHFYVLFHTVSVWLTVVVAIWRVMGVCYSLQTAELRTAFRAKIAVFCTYLASAIVCIPEYLHYEIHSYVKSDGSEGFIIGNTALYDNNYQLFDNIDDWGFNIILYLMPCLPLTGFTFALIRKIYRGKKKRAKLNVRTNKVDLSNDRLTMILIIILLVFLFVKVPPGIMYVLDFGLGYKIVHQVHFVFAGTINTLILVNSAVNFFVYFFMSSQFRASANAVFCKSVVKKVQTIRMRPMQKANRENKTVANGV